MLKWEPYEVRDVLGSGRWTVVGATFCGVRAIGLRSDYYDGIRGGWCHRVIHNWHLQKYPRVDEDKALHSDIRGIKESMLLHGATSTVVDWIGELSPFTDKELSIMAAKLATKGTPAKAPKADAAEKTKPVKAAKTGNPEALEKARAAAAGKRAEGDKQKITINTEKKANPYREGTKAYATFDLIKQHKTVGDVRAAAGEDHDLGYLRYASRDGHITLS